VIWRPGLEEGDSSRRPVPWRERSIAVGGVTIRTEVRWLTVRQIIAQSSNVGAIKIGQKLGKSLYYHYMSAFGFGSLTGVDLPGETPGLMRRPKGWSALSLSVLSLGQEVSVTPIQFATAFAAIANGGNLMRPYVIRSLRTSDGTQARDTGPVVVRRVISESTARRSLTARSRRGRRSGGASCAVAGKTGRPRRSTGDGPCSHRKIVASFVGAVPAGAW
jgi:cell division protein FtsI (penicillin-binding protein 3)